MPKISAHIATRNNAAFIAQAVRGVLAEPYKDIEIVILDDASDDGNWEAIQKAIEGVPNARASRAPSQLGVAKARRHLMESSDSEYILVVDGDDIIAPGAVQERLEFLDANPGYGGAYGKMRMMDRANRLLPRTIGMPFSRFELSFLNMVCHPGHLLRRSAVEEAGGYLETGGGANSVGEDHYLWFRISLTKDIAFFNRIVSFYRIHQTQLTQLPQPHFKASENWILKEALSLRPEISQPLMSGQPLKVNQENWRATMLMLGAISRLVPPESESFGKILEFASKVDPHDYGVALKSFNFQFGARKDYAKALERSEALLREFPEDTPLKVLALDMKKAALKASGAGAEAEAAVDRQMEEANRALLELPPGLSAPEPAA